MAKLDLREEASAAAPDLTIDGVLQSLDEAERDAACATWRGRMVNEHISSRVFGVLVGQLIAAGVKPSRVKEAATFASDELRHAVACAGVLTALGGEAVADLPELPPVPAHEDVGPVEALVRNLLSICCLSETVAVALISAEYFELEGTEIGHVLRDILADEVRHSRFGWELTAELLPSLDSAAIARLNHYLATALQHLHDHELRHISPLSTTPAAARVGVCDGGQARKLFFDTVDDVILPALRDRGLSADYHWARIAAQA